MNKKYLKLSLVILVLFTFCANAQKYKFAESETVVKDYLHEFFQVGPDKYIDVNYASPHGAFSLNRDDRNTIITAYDKTLKQVYSSPVAAFKGLRYVAGISSNSQLYLFFTDDHNNVSKFQLNDGNGTAQQLDKLFTVPGKFQFFESGYSSDSSYCYLVCSNRNNTSENAFDGVIMDKQMKVITRFSVAANQSPKDISNIQYMLSNDGLFYIIAAVKGNTTKEVYAPLQYNIMRFDKDGKPATMTLPDVPPGLLDNMAWQTTSNGLFFTGMLSRTEKAGFTTIVSGLFDVQQKKVINMKAAEISGQISKTGIPVSFRLVASYILSDKSMYFVIEASSHSTYDNFSAWTARGGSGGTMSQYAGGTNYWSGLAYVIKLSPGKEIEWIQSVVKSQLEPSAIRYTGMITLKDNYDGIQLFFHDMRKNEQVEDNNKLKGVILQGRMKDIYLAAVHINKEGKTSKQFLLDNGDTDYHLSTVNYISTGNNKIIYTAYRYRNAGASSYKIATITIN